MLSKREYVVCFGRVQSLLDSREALLKQAGYLTLTTTKMRISHESA